jgi:phosphatidylinositol alpha-1,6-mannosyltransferase
LSGPLRVLLATPDFPPARGGIQALLHGLARNLADVELTVVAPAHSEARGFDARQDCRVIRVPRAPVHRATIAALNLAALRTGRAYRPDVVISGHIVTSPAVRAIGRPWVQFLYAKEIGARHGLARRAIEVADATIAISEHTRRLAARLGVPAARLHVVPPGVELPAYPVRSPVGAPRSLILTIARLEDRYKGTDTLIRALPLLRARVPDAELAVVGDGQLRPWLERLAHANRVQDHVHFAGDVSDDDRDAWFDRSAVFAMPSRLPAGEQGGEGFGIVYLEASARGVPVVAGNVGGAVDAVHDGVTGLLVEPQDHVAVADTLALLLTDRALRRRMSDAGPGWARGFAWERVAGRVREILAAAAEHRVRPAPELDG